MKQISSELGTILSKAFSIIILGMLFPVIFDSFQHLHHSFLGVAVFISSIIAGIALLILAVKYVFFLERAVFMQDDDLAIEKYRRNMFLSDRLEFVPLANVKDIRQSRFPIMPRISITYVHHAVIPETIEFLLTTGWWGERKPADIMADLRARVALAKSKTAVSQ